VIESHPIPADMPNKCCFGGPDLDRFYVTTAGGRLYQAKAGRCGFPKLSG
jgi:sugar lactone lactonase YvrE